MRHLMTTSFRPPTTHDMSFANDSMTSLSNAVAIAASAADHLSQTG